jgi:hypothetical protein
MSMQISLRQLPKFLEENYGILVSYLTVWSWIKKFDFEDLTHKIEFNGKTYRFFEPNDVAILVERLKKLYREKKIKFRLKKI